MIGGGKRASTRQVDDMAKIINSTTGSTESCIKRLVPRQTLHKDSFLTIPYSYSFGLARKNKLKEATGHENGLGPES
ncbi:unnamed protein product [Haemonchus placei]|uniref:Ovule protein n=1 Tax=Haemonchus placei TaxID=6290 RepID=A0A0N4W120_HAEPC|nr:unnamed protein product [Haemonchus placei]